MLKILSFVLLLLPLNSAFGMPSVGDYIAYQAGQSLSGALTEWIVEREITAQFEDRFEITETLTLSTGAVSVSRFLVEETDLLTGENVQIILNNCSALDGEIVDGHFPIGTVSTCRITSQSPEVTRSTFYYNVPFGMASYTETTADRFLYFTVTSFRFGN